MDVNDFREFGKEAIDFIADYLENIRDRYKTYYYYQINVCINYHTVQMCKNNYIIFTNM